MHHTNIPENVLAIGPSGCSRDLTYPRFELPIVATDSLRILFFRKRNGKHNKEASVFLIWSTSRADWKILI